MTFATTTAINIFIFDTIMNKLSQNELRIINKTTNEKEKETKEDVCDVLPTQYINTI